jgi:3-deoxy-D-manno-octulosonic-acid transferase
VLEIASGFSPIPEVAGFCDTDQVIVAGSTWAADEEIIAAHLSRHPSLRCIIAPHEIHESHLKQVEALFPGSIRFSQWSRQQGGEFRTLIVDNIGMLSRLYHYASVSYIGGGFGKGIHNTLEAAVHGKPVVFGPRFGKFREAVELVRCGGGFSVADGSQYAKQMDSLLEDPALLDRSGKAAGDFVRQQAGATAAILRYIQEKRLLTS